MEVHPLERHPSKVEGHPLARVLLAAAVGRFPPPDGRVEVVPPWRPEVRGVVSFTGRTYVAADGVGIGALLDLGADAFGGATGPAVLSRLADSAPGGSGRPGDPGGPGGTVGGEVGCLDAVLVGRGRGGAGPLVERPDLADHPRVLHARAWRDDVRVLGPRPGGPAEGLVTLSRGIAGLTEVSIEVATVGRGRGAALLADALTLVPYGDPVWACVAPGNVASLRLFLRSGFEPVASVQLVRPAG